MRIGLVGLDEGEPALVERLMILIRGERRGNIKLPRDELNIGDGPSKEADGVESPGKALDTVLTYGSIPAEYSAQSTNVK